MHEKLAQVHMKHHHHLGFTGVTMVTALQLLCEQAFFLEFVCVHCVACEQTVE